MPLADLSQQTLLANQNRIMSRPEEFLRMIVAAQ